MLDIEEKTQILDELFIAYRQVWRIITDLGRNFCNMQIDFIHHWENSAHKEVCETECFLMPYTNFVNAVREDARNCFLTGYCGDLVEMCFLENHLRNIILKLTGFIKQKSDFCEEEKFGPTTTNSDNSDLSSERTSNSSQN